MGSIRCGKAPVQLFDATAQKLGAFLVFETEPLVRREARDQLLLGGALFQTLNAHAKVAHPVARVMLRGAGRSFRFCKSPCVVWGMILRKVGKPGLPAGRLRNLGFSSPTGKFVAVHPVRAGPGFREEAKGGLQSAVTCVARVRCS